MGGWSDHHLTAGKVAPDRGVMEGYDVNGILFPRLGCDPFSGWWLFSHPSEKYAQVKLDHFPQVEVNIKKHVKPPVSFDRHLLW